MDTIFEAIHEDFLYSGEDINCSLFQQVQTDNVDDPICSDCPSNTDLLSLDDIDEDFFAASEFERANFSIPLVKWNDSDEIPEVTFTVDNSKCKGWDTAKTEISHLLERLTNLTGKNKPSKKDILKLLFGRDSCVVTTFKRELQTTYEEFCAFMATLCLQAASRASVTDLYSVATSTSKLAAMKQEDYLKFFGKDSNMQESKEKQRHLLWKCKER